MRVVLLAAGLAFACEIARPPIGADEGPWPSQWPTAEVGYESEYLRVVPLFEQPICRGSLEAMERHIITVTTELDVPPTQATVFWFNDMAQGANRAASRGECFPCFKYDAAYSDWNTMFHELVHSQANPNLGRSEQILTESIAYGFDGSHVWERSENPQSPSQRIGSGGTHERFVRWLLKVHGSERLALLFEAIPRGTSSTAVTAAFEAVVGESFSTIEDNFLETADEVYEAPGACDGLPVVEWDSGVWSVNVEVDCNATNVFGPMDPDSRGAGMSAANNVVAFVMNVPEAVIGRELQIVRPLELQRASALPCLAGSSDDIEAAQTLTLSPALGVALRAASYRVEVPAGPDGRATIRLESKN